MKAINKIIGLFLLVFLVSSCGQGEEEEKENNKEKTIKVSVQTIKPQKFTKTFVANGHVEALKQIMVSPEIPGMIQKINVEEGQKVRKGQTLFVLNTSVVQNQIDEVKKRLELATTLFEKQKELWDQGIGSEVQFLQAQNNMEALQQSLETLQSQQSKGYVRAPFSGIVDQIMLKEGDIFGGASPVMLLVNLDNVKVLADVSESYLADIEIGDSIDIHFPAWDITRRAEIHRTSNVINPDSRTFVVEARLTNEDHKLKPNIVAEMTITEFENEKAIVVPSNIIKQDLNKDYFLFVVKETQGEDGKVVTAEKRTVKRTHVSKGETMIDAGLEVGDKVIVKGYDIVSTGTEVIVK